MTKTNNPTRSEFWNTIISPERLFDPDVSIDKTDKRSVFDMDHDRIVYSSYFRKMHDKTQVFPYAPLSSTNQARSRLSHSLEVSCVGRSLGFLAGKHLLENGIKVIPYDLGMITATACLAHDIGNPPFGHAGEDAIKKWANDNNNILFDNWELQDILNFEGNAQGFRILTKLEAWQRKGGLRTTLATLGAFIKYPCSSIDVNNSANEVSEKKFGFFKDDMSSFSYICEKLQIPKRKDSNASYPRHPLAFLTEAADDICYAIVDLEDSYHLGITSFSTVKELMEPIARNDVIFDDDEEYDDVTRLARYRSAAISSLVRQAIDIFINNLNKIESFSYNRSLISEISDKEYYNTIKKYSYNYIYSAPKVMEIESAGFTAITGLLEIFMSSILAENPDRHQFMNRNIIPKSCLRRRNRPVSGNTAEEYISVLSPYERMLSVTDYITGMTDRFLIELYQRLSGIKITDY
jgi:dGTPase